MTDDERELVEANTRVMADIQMLPIRMAHAQIDAGIKMYRELLESKIAIKTYRMLATGIVPKGT
jgi:hypothetical protein